MRDTVYKFIYYCLLFCISSFSTAISALELGVGTHFQSYKEAPTVYIELLKNYGFTSFRDDYPWSKVELQPNNYQASRYVKNVDYAFLNAKKNGLSPILILDYGNKFHNDGGYPSTDKEIIAFSKYASWTAQRFKGNVKYYEIWNEWTIGTGMVKFRKTIPSAQVYYKLVKSVSEAIHNVDPNAIIIAGSLNPLDRRARYIDKNDWQWFYELVQLGIMNYIDGVSLHTYAFMNGNRTLRTPEGNLEFIDYFHRYFSGKAGKDVSIYITETGVTNYNGPGGMSLTDSANYIKTYTEGVRKRPYIKGLWWYDLVNDGANINNKEHNFGFFMQDLTPKQAAYEIKGLR
ncbi:cellulase family glycosylhydrolase [Klebsiella pasteurii]|uniref:cellulase family glycosylhydrolase n=1 Tax=Klebsiella pasteurii TaxID=2587529 RepID=UPI001168D567|nr:cellulase family glycosylhydrolase [Klebsiella pasteurii]VUS39189.1 hypothetical protein SB6420_04912 [Klebsiella pasteurii]